jgi:hypothetical protein
VKGEALFAALCGVDDKFIDEAARSRRAAAGGGALFYVRRLAPIAACLALALTALLLPKISRDGTLNSGGNAPYAASDEITEYSQSAAEADNGSGNGSPEAFTGADDAFEGDDALLAQPEAAPVPAPSESVIDEGACFVPALSGDELTLDEARSDPDFGAFIPGRAPDGFAFGSAYRVPDGNYLSVSWSDGAYGYIGIIVSEASGDDLSRVVSADEREKYDLSLYPVPRSESVPGELREVVNSPVFASDEISPEIIRARAYESGESGADSGKWVINFGLLYGGTLVRVSSKGITPGQAWDMLRELG